MSCALPNFRSRVPRRLSGPADCKLDWEEPCTSAKLVLSPMVPGLRCLLLSTACEPLCRLEKQAGLLQLGRRQAASCARTGLHQVTHAPHFESGHGASDASSLKAACLSQSHLQDLMPPVISSSEVPSCRGQAKPSGIPSWRFGLDTSRPGPTRASIRPRRLLSGFCLGAFSFL